MARTYERFNLHSTPERFYVEACDRGSDDVLTVDRVSTDIALAVRRDIPPCAAVRPICGVMGTIRLLAGMYLVVITDKKKVGDLLGHAVWKALDFDVVSYPKTLRHLTDKQTQVNRLLLTMVYDVLHTESFYFATDYDLTHTLQRQADARPGFRETSLLERADQRFVWNAHLLREFLARPELHRFACPVMHGFVATESCCVNGKVFEWNVVSRRSRFRAGVRYYVRGIDAEGHAANFVETEQIVRYDGSKASFVQTRGSIPLYWSQRPNLKYKPKPEISNAVNHLDGLQRHFDSQIGLYGKQVILNLMDQSGSEKSLEAAFDDTVSSLANGKVKYVAFDFHKECSRMRWHRLQSLVGAVAPTQDQLGYLLVDAKGNVLLRQEGTFRSSCMDCLDRTNVVQSMLARRSLQAQLQRMGVLRAAGQRLEDQADFEATFRNAWADNADACSRQYAGTGALKTDFTRTGRRTHWGLLADGWTSVVRYCKNNFSDGFRQDSIDLFLGNYAVGEEDLTASLLGHHAGAGRGPGSWRLPFLAVAFSMFNVSLLTAGNTWSETLPHAVFWGTASVLTAGSVLRAGVVDVPKLVQKESDGKTDH